jgi:predicted RNA-binding Zn ribbon-like protein
MWRRMKLCGNGRCAVAFFDRSRNNSGVWHDVAACGNAINLRASRARRRARVTGSAAETSTPDASPTQH